MTPPLPLDPELEPIGIARLHQPHHDAGPRFCSSAAPPLGGDVDMRVWVPARFPVRAVAVRQVIDGETVNRPLERERDDGMVDAAEARTAGGGGTAGGEYWRTTISAANPVTHYRFLLLGAEGNPVPYAWLNAAGLFPFDVSDSADFRLLAGDDTPAWVADAIVYQVFPDRFARSERAAGLAVPGWATEPAWGEEPSRQGEQNGAQLYGGDLWGVRERLDHIESLGANTVYLTPIFPAGSAHRYDATSFDRVDPPLGGEAALTALVDAVHARGMRLVLDLTTNHTGADHAWFQRAIARPDSPERSFYHFTSWPDEYASWLDVASMPKLDHRNPELRRRLYEGTGSVVARWLTGPHGADGWRIDVANMTGRFRDLDVTHEVARTVRATMREVAETTGRATWLVAEHGHDATRDLQVGGWMGTMNYQGFTRPLWAWLNDGTTSVNWLGLPTTVPRLPGQNVARTLTGYNAEMPFAARLASQDQLASHDTPRIRTVAGTAELQFVAAAAMVALPGVPTVFMGDELGFTGEEGEISRTPMPWDLLDRMAGGEDVSGQPRAGQQVDARALDLYRDLLRLRADEPALRRGGIRLVHAEADALVLARTHPEGDLLAHLARDAHDAITLPLAALDARGAEAIHCVGETTGATTPAASALRAAGGPALQTAGTVLELRSSGPGAAFWRLTD